MCDWQNRQLKEIIVVRNGIKQTKNLGGEEDLQLTWVNFALFVVLGDYDIMNTKKLKIR